MNGDLKILIVLVIIALLVSLIAGLLAASVFRRVFKGRKYRKLDGLQAHYRESLVRSLNAASGIADARAYLTVAGSDAWQALENVLFDLVEDPHYRGEIIKLFDRLGYVAFYENGLAHRNVLIKATSADKLGRMRSESSTGKLLPLLDEKDPEILSVAVRALSRIGSEKGLRGIIDRMPVLLGKSFVTRKAMEASLLNFGPGAIPHLISYQSEHADPWILSCILETLSRLPVDDRSVALAAERLGNSHAEVRSKALKVLESAGADLPDGLCGRICALLGDPIWFVRLQAVKAVRARGGEKAAAALKKCLFDENWQVRNGAALALARLGDRSIDVFLETLRSIDGYAKESVCEEIENTGLAERLIQNLTASDETLRMNSRAILKIMHDLHFSTPLAEYVERGGDMLVKREICSLMEEPHQ